MKLLQMSGLRFNRLVVLFKDETNKGKRIKLQRECEIFIAN